MTERELARFINRAIFDAPACPDGARGMACPSCAADFIAAELIAWEIVPLSDPSARV